MIVGWIALGIVWLVGWGMLLAIYQDKIEHDNKIYDAKMRGEIRS